MKQSILFLTSILCLVIFKQSFSANKTVLLHNCPPLNFKIYDYRNYQYKLEKCKGLQGEIRYQYKQYPKTGINTIGISGKKFKSKIRRKK